MRNNINRKKILKLFVLGAGASYAASQVKRAIAQSDPVYEAPLDAAFAHRIKSIVLQQPTWISEARDRLLATWKHEAPFESLGLERAILIQLAHLEFIHAIHPRRSRELISRHEWMNLVSHVACIILRRCRQNSARLYERFAEWCLPTPEQTNGWDNRIITFNYDTLLDSILLKRIPATDLYFDAIRNRQDTPSRAKQEYPILLKLHGSINWRCTEEAFGKIIEGSIHDEIYEIPEIWLDEMRVPEPGDKVAPLILPPLPSKPISGIKLFRYLWTCAYEYLYEAEELVIIGYSLPNADQMSVSMFSNFQSQRLKKVVIIDPSTAVLARWRSTLRRRGIKIVEWAYYETFRDYLDAQRA